MNNDDISVLLYDSIHRTPNEMGPVVAFLLHLHIHWSFTCDQVRKILRCSTERYLVWRKSKSLEGTELKRSL